MKLSICIPTYNRASLLDNCLNSIRKSSINLETEFEVCISDNCSNDNTQEVVKKYKKFYIIKYNRNEKNIGIPLNFLKVISIAEGDFAWLVGDDDLLLPHSIQKLLKLIYLYSDVDFFYVNAFHYNIEKVLEKKQPFDVIELPKDLKKFSKNNTNSKMPFLSLISPKISFDFLGGMFLSVFRREKWIDAETILNKKAINDMRTFSHFDNTFPHIKIFSKAFAKSNAFFNSDPLIVCLSGAREWRPKYPLVRSYRLIEALETYKDNGLPYINYLNCKNFALSHFIPDTIRMILNSSVSGIEYVSISRSFLKNFFYPNLYFSPLVEFYQKLYSIFLKVQNK